MDPLSIAGNELSSAADVQFVSFVVDDELFGVDIRTVKEITPALEIMHVPRADAHVSGLVNVRGQVVLVLDVAVILGRKREVEVAAQQIVILKTAEELSHVPGLDPTFETAAFGDKPLGILVDDLKDVIHVMSAEIEVTPPHVPQQNSPFYSGVAQLSEGLLVILNLSELLACSGERAFG